MEIKDPKKLYRVEQTVEELPLAPLRSSCVDVEKFQGYCRACENWEKNWSCPPYPFDELALWNSYEGIMLFCRKVIFTEEALALKFQPEELGRISKALLREEQLDLLETLIRLEQDFPGSRALAAGSCAACAPLDCARKSGQPCRQPQRLRYSLEALGADVGKICRDFLHQDLVWGQDGKLPPYYLIVGALLKK